MKWYVIEDQGRFCVVQDSPKGLPGVIDSEWQKSETAQHRANDLNRRENEPGDKIRVMMDRIARSGYN